MVEDKINWSDFIAARRDHSTIEHIYPREPRRDEWPTFASKTEQERNCLLNSLGNLLACSRPRNSRFWNRAFRDKRHDPNGMGYDTGSYSEIAVARNEDWTPEAVLSRGLDMLDFLERRWRIHFGPRAEKVRYLNLDFMEL
jgi:hypothetical protein